MNNVDPTLIFQIFSDSHFFSKNSTYTMRGIRNSLPNINLTTFQKLFLHNREKLFLLNVEKLFCTGRKI